MQTNIHGHWTLNMYNQSTAHIYILNYLHYTYIWKIILHFTNFPCTCIIMDCEFWIVGIFQIWYITYSLASKIRYGTNSHHVFEIWDTFQCKINKNRANFQIFLILIWDAKYLHPYKNDCLIKIDIKSFVSLSLSVIGWYVKLRINCIF